MSLLDDGPLSILGGGLISSAGSLIGNAMQIGQQDKIMGWQERMSNTAYQRQVADMRKAGINPMLAAMKGGGASVPGTPMANVSNPLAGAGGGLSAAAQMNMDQKRLDNETRSTDAQVNQANAAAEKNRADAQSSLADARYKGGLFDKLGSDTALVQAQTLSNQWSAQLMSLKENEQAVMNKLYGVALSGLTALMKFAGGGKSGDADAVIANTQKELKALWDKVPSPSSAARSLFDSFMNMVTWNTWGTSGASSAKGQSDMMKSH